MYEVDPLDDLVGELPDGLSTDFTELRVALELSPGSVGRPWIATNPTGLRTVTFGDGRAVLVFGVLERDRRVFLVELVVL